MFGLSPYLIIGALFSGIALSVGGYFTGAHFTATAYELQISELKNGALEASQKQRQAELIQASNASTGFENDQAKAKIVYRTIHDEVEKIVDRPVYRNVCLDDDGLRLVNAALAGVPTSTNPRELKATVPDAHTSP